METANPEHGADTGPASEARELLYHRTFDAAGWNVARLRSRKNGQRISVVLPARDESATIGAIVTAIRTSLVHGAGLVDEVVVVDSRSSDGTARVAARSGAIVAHQDEIRPDLGQGNGKGDALWKSLFVATGDLVVFLDADVRGFSPSCVTGLLGPLLSDDRTCYVKACYDRSRPDGAEAGTVGGRVSELVARPLLNLYWPHLAGFVQPLAGEAAGRRDVLRRVPFATGYGVELGLLVDLAALVGVDALAQVDMGRHEHSHQPTADLGVMAAHVHAAATRRLATGGGATGDTLVQYAREPGSGSAFHPYPRPVATSDRPPHSLVDTEALALPPAPVTGGATTDAG